MELETEQSEAGRIMGPVIFRNDSRGIPDLDPDTIRKLLLQTAS